MQALSARGNYGYAVSGRCVLGRGNYCCDVAELFSGFCGGSLRFVSRDGKMYVVTQAHSFRAGASKPSLEAWMDHPFQDSPDQK